MAFFQILSWQDIPSQLKVWDDSDEVRRELPKRFMVLIDAAAQAQGLTGTDDYLGQWAWSDEEEREGNAADVAEALVKELEARYRT